MSESSFYSNAIFFIEIDKIKPNPFQPRREFDQAKLQDLSESIRMYGILQPLVVTRKEVIKPDGGLATEYELIAGERRLRASKLAGLREVPSIIRAKEDDDRVKLELAIIENLQREDISPVDKARAFKQLAEKFNLKHNEIAKKVGKSREYISNSIRILNLPEEMLDAMAQGKITEGHSRPLLMLIDRPEEQNVLFRDIMLRKLTVRDAEKIARKIATDRVRKLELLPDPEISEIEHEVGTLLGTRVNIVRKQGGGKIQIDFFSPEDLKHIVELLKTQKAMPAPRVLQNQAQENNTQNTQTPLKDNVQSVVSDSNTPKQYTHFVDQEDSSQQDTQAESQEDTSSDKFADQQITIETPSYEDEEDDEELYSMKDFSL